MKKKAQAFEVGEPLTLTKNLAKLGIKNARDHKGKVIASFTVRETNGDDETAAAQSAAQRKDNLITPQEELVKLSIVSVNGEAVDQPYDYYDRWNSKARQLAMTACRQLNGTSPQEMEAFLRDGELDEGEDSSPPDSQSDDESRID